MEAAVPIDIELVGAKMDDKQYTTTERRYNEKLLGTLLAIEYLVTYCYWENKCRFAFAWWKIFTKADNGIPINLRVACRAY